MSVNITHQSVGIARLKLCSCVGLHRGIEVSRCSLIGPRIDKTFRSLVVQIRGAERSKGVRTHGLTSRRLLLDRVKSLNWFLTAIKPFNCKFCIAKA